MYNQNAAFANWKTERFVFICIHKKQVKLLPINSSLFLSCIIEYKSLKLKIKIISIPVILNECIQIRMIIINVLLKQLS